MLSKNNSVLDFLKTNKQNSKYTQKSPARTRLGDIPEPNNAEYCHSVMLVPTLVSLQNLHPAGDRIITSLASLSASPFPGVGPLFPEQRYTYINDFYPLGPLSYSP